MSASVGQRSRRAVAVLVVLGLVPGGCRRAPDVPTANAAETAPQQLWTCGMHPQVIQDKPGTCPICGMELTPLKAAPSGGEARRTERRILHWWDPMMSPPYISDKPGKSPMGMDLVPVYEDEAAGGTAVAIDPVIVQNMGVRLAQVTEGPLRKTIRAVGFLEEAQPNQYDVNLRVSGWIEHLYANVEGMHVRVGDPLFELYSPELRVGIEELIAARRVRARQHAEKQEFAAANTLYEAAERKLLLWGLPRAQVTRLAAREEAPATVTFTSPMTGHIVEKAVVDGAAVKAGERVMRIVDHALLWLDGQVFEQDLPYVRLGQRVTATVAAMPSRRFDGEITFFHPHVDPMTRTALVRVALPNPGLTLRPGMYGTVEIESELTDRALLVPREAVIDTGTREIVFVTADRSHFEPRRVTLGSSGADGTVQVLSGLAPGETVVVSGQFLLDSESRLKEAIEKHVRERLAVDPGMPAADDHGEREHGQRDH